VVPAQDGLLAILKGRAFSLEDWPEVFRSPTAEFPAPKVVMLRDYVSINAEPKFCRRSILLRDRFRCQYCGVRFDGPELTFDHVIPRAKGGKTEWANILSCCVDCNRLKRDRPANWSGRKGGGLRPLKAPRRPTTMELLRAGLEFLDPQIKESYGDWLYWSAELHP
jgi:5-methylcytosine-specific restriction endonuclease McrA